MFRQQFSNILSILFGSAERKLVYFVISHKFCGVSGKLTHFLGEQVDVRLVAAVGRVEELDESECLGGGRDRHDERRQAGAAHVHQPALGQQDDALAVRPDHMIHLRTHLLPGQVRCTQTILFRHAQISQFSQQNNKNLDRKRTTSISVFECPMLQTMQPFFILSMCSRVTTFLLPVAVMTMSTFLITSFSFTTRKPSML
jgi:hypothetical protein